MSVEINFSENYGVGMTGWHDKKIGKLMTPLKMHIQGESDALGTARAQKEMELLYCMDRSDGFADTYSIEDTLGMMTPVLAGNSAPNQRTNETGSKVIYNIPFMVKTSVTHQLIEDSRGRLTENIRNKGSLIPHSYYKTRQWLAVQALVSATNGKKIFSYKDIANIDLTALDGLSLFHNAHTYGVGSDHVNAGKGGTQSNSYYVTLGANAGVTSGAVSEYIDEIANKLRNMKDENGDPMGYTGDLLLIPGNRPKLERAVKSALGTDRAAGNNYNDINVNFGNYSLVASPLWQSDTDEIIMLSTECNKNCKGNVFLDREKLQTRIWEDDDTLNLMFRGYCRWGLGFNTYKHAVRLKIRPNGASDSTAYMTNLA